MYYVANGTSTVHITLEHAKALHAIVVLIKEDWRRGRRPWDKMQNPEQGMKRTQQ
jgi:hypothetical protein